MSNAKSSASFLGEVMEVYVRMLTSGQLETALCHWREAVPSYREGGPGHRSLDKAITLAEAAYRDLQGYMLGLPLAILGTGMIRAISGSGSDGEIMTITLRLRGWRLKFTWDHGRPSCLACQRHGALQFRNPGAAGGRFWLCWRHGWKYMRRGV